ncbi:uncharacterized protein [Henckelia pumila]|uniref:uncharacterized protein n=1 Tax=Henckelia pumila TaxID=405737 RepID=UPI003C6E9A0F
MKKRFVPNQYYRDMFRRLQTLKQGSRSVKDYNKDLETTMIWTNVEEDNEATMTRFLCGLNREIQDQVVLRHCFDLDEMVQMAMKVEQQLKRRGAGRLPTAGGTSTSWCPNIAKREDNKPVSRKKILHQIGGAKENSKSQCPNKKLMIIKACGDVESESGEGEENYDGMPALVDPDDEDGFGAVVGELLVTRRVLNAQPKEKKVSEREKLFHTRCFVNGKEFDDLFSKKLPQGLPPLRGIEHQIDLVLGSALPNRPAYKSNPEETKELHQQKCVFCTNELVFLGFVVSAQGVRVDEEKIECDVSGVGVGGVLTQGGKPVAYFSETLSGESLNYPTYNKEFYALGLSMKELDASDVDFAEIYESCMHGPKDKFYMHDGYLFKEDKLCIPTYSIRELLVRELHSGGLIGHFGVAKKYQILHEHFYWPYLKHDVEKMCEWVSMNGRKKAEFVRSLHEKVREDIEKKNFQYTKQANKGRKKVVFEPGDWFCLQLRKEQFSGKRHSKLLPRGDGPFQVLERINDNS